MMSDPAEPKAEEECLHNWKHIDASFSHEFGTEQIHYWECDKCGEQRDRFDGDEVEEERADDGYERALDEP